MKYLFVIWKTFPMQKNGNTRIRDRTWYVQLAYFMLLFVSVRNLKNLIILMWCDVCVSSSLKQLLLECLFLSIVHCSNKKCKDLATVIYYKQRRQHFECLAWPAFFFSFIVIFREVLVITNPNYRYIFPLPKLNSVFFSSFIVIFREVSVITIPNYCFILPLNSWQLFTPPIILLAASILWSLVRVWIRQVYSPYRTMQATWPV